MAHANSLRVIGQTLEVAKLRVFELQTDGPNYLVRSDCLTKAAEWILHYAFGLKISEGIAGERTIARLVNFSSADIVRLDEQARQQARTPSVDREEQGRLSQLLRTLGDHLDRSEASAFHISWTYDSVSVDYRLADGQSSSRTFTAEKLEQLGSLARFGRLARTRFGPKSPDSHEDSHQPGNPMTEQGRRSDLRAKDLRSNKD
jgi:hypothetical protein